MKFYHKNPRAVTEKQFGNLRETLPELGDLGGIVHDLNSDEVIGGNQRVRAMGLLGVEPVIVERYDPPNAQGTVAVGYYEVNGEQFKYRAVMWTPRQCEKANVVANKAGGTWDFDTLANDFEMDDLLEWGFEEGELIGWPQEESAEDPGAQLDKAAELQEKWGVVRGDIWVIESVATPGKFHRVMCGDSTSAEDVGRLTAGSDAILMIADPPYGVGRDKGFGGFGGFGPPIARRQYKDEWDTERPEKAFFDGILALAPLSVIFGGNYFTDLLPQGNHWIVWDKQNTMPTFGDCELAWTNASRDSVKKYTVVYNGLIGKETDRFHPTQKPAAIMAAIIGDYADQGEMVIDPCCGSGPVLVACEQTGRIGYGMEIEPKYVSVTLERLAGMGLEPQRVTQ